ncbi:hypothetical protein TNCV_3843811 [Trichonephila clavipes]|nr:hypothetical protein TNCV_3843811 [Trichonephila clavipes]
MKLFRSYKLYGRGKCCGTCPPHMPHIFDGVQMRAMRCPANVLHVRLMFNGPILNTSGTMYTCIIAHEVSVTVKVKMQHCRVHLICQYIQVSHDHLFTLEKHKGTIFPSQQDVLHIMVLPPDCAQGK